MKNNERKPMGRFNEIVTLRDFFAGMAFAGMIATDNLQSWAGNRVGSVAHVAYKFADELLAARKDDKDEI